MGIAGVARGHHTIEHIDALRNGINNVLRRAHAHQIARLFGRQQRAAVLYYFAHLVFGFANGETAECIAIEAKLNEPRERFLAQVAVHATLNDAEQRRLMLAMCLLAPTRPTHRQLHRLARLFTRCRIRRAFVEHHNDV